MNDDRDVLGTAHDWARAGHGVTLVTVARSWGSSPRPPGALMAVRDDGRAAGSVSGGCVEEELLGRIARGEAPRELPLRICYGAAEASRLGLPCGGRLELVLEAVDAAALEPLLAALDGPCLHRRLDLASGEVRLEPDPGGPEFGYDGQTLSRAFGPRWRLLLVGAVDLARQVARLGRDLGYGVTVCDPRSEARAGWQLPGVALDPRMPDEAAAALADHPRCALLTLSHDPRLDDLALAEALPGRAFYVGALGSRASAAKRRARLLEFGLAPADVARLHAPAGLPIGSRTPSEIALSMLAQITAVRRAAA